METLVALDMDDKSDKYLDNRSAFSDELIVKLPFDRRYGPTLCSVANIVLAYLKNLLTKIT